MANESGKIEAALKKIAKELNSLFDEDHCLKSVQILLPVSPQNLSLIKRYTLADEREKYQEITRKFTGEHKERVEYSLFYLQYDEPYKYREIECELDINEVKFDSVVSEPIKIEADERKRLSDPNKLTETWNRWVDEFKKSGYARSTLWSYIKINHHDLAEIQASDNVNGSDCIIIAAFLTFNKYFDENVDDNSLKLSVANKKVQDYLHTLTLSLFTKEIEKTTILAKIAEIINRNYAHHIGSHVSRRASLEKILERLGIDIEEDKEKKGGLNKWQLASIAKMRSRLEKYKDERSEFIASVTSSPVPQSFNFYTDIIRPFTENTLLIDTIARNEGICYQKKNGGKLKACEKLSHDENTLSQLVIRVFIHDDLISGECDKEPKRFRDDLSKIPDNYKEQRVIYDIKGIDNNYDSLSIPYYLRHTDFLNTFYEEAETVLKDFQVDLPGALGKHAIYSLLENYIRNVAKHSYNHNEDKGEPVEIILKIAPDEKASDKLKLILTDNISNDSVVDELNEKILKPITDKNIGMGIADMKICACLLAEKELSDENLRESLEAVSDNCRLAYSLQLSKPKNVALIGVRKIEENPSEGIFFYENFEDFFKNSSSNFQFAIINDELLDGEIHQQNKNRFPLRLFILTEKEKKADVINRCKYVDEIDEENLLEWCWQNWIEFKSNSKTHLGIYFDQEEDAPLPKVWKEKSEAWNESHDKPFSVKVYYKDESKIYPDIPVDSSKRHIYFDRHGKILEKCGGGSIKFTEENFWELIDKNNPDFDLISSTDTHTPPFLLPYRMVDAATTNILVIDERVTEMAHQPYTEDSDIKSLVTSGGFRKYEDVAQSSDCQFFDACWASNIFVATHIDDIPVSNRLNEDEGDEKRKHFLKIRFKKTKEKTLIESKVNFIEKVATRDLGVKGNQWVNNDGSKFEMNNWNDIYHNYDIKYDCLLIHRTKLKDIIENEEYGMEFINQLDVSKIYIVTGGGVVDFLPEGHGITVLPSNILHDYILGRRPAKLTLTKILR